MRGYLEVHLSLMKLSGLRSLLMLQLLSLRKKPPPIFTSFLIHSHNFNTKGLQAFTPCSGHENSVRSGHIASVDGSERHTCVVGSSGKKFMKSTHLSKNTASSKPYCQDRLGVPRGCICESIEFSFLSPMSPSMHVHTVWRLEQPRRQ